MSLSIFGLCRRLTLLRCVLILCHYAERRHAESRGAIFDLYLHLYLGRGRDGRRLPIERVQLHPDPVEILGPATIGTKIMGRPAVVFWDL